MHDGSPYTEDVEHTYDFTITNDLPADNDISNPYGDLSFRSRRAFLKDRDGEIILNEEVIFSDNFDDNSVNIITDKYLANSAKRKETDIRQMFDRVSETIGDFGEEQNYFDSDGRNVFVNKLKYYQAHQYFAFNSPVYFNLGIDEKPQCSACYICELEDNMESIMDWMRTESLVFKKGSGSGVNGSKLRSRKEHVGTGNGFASGPVSFWKGSDVLASIIKSGGILRRAAKMFRLDIVHPDVLDGVYAKSREEEKMRILKRGGITPLKSSEMSDEVFFQNTNFSVGITDDFMHAVENNGIWYTRAVLTGEPVDKYDAHDMMMRICEQTRISADPGIQFHDTINFMNTLPAEGVIESSNPCSEYFSQPNHSCNLAALNLIKFFEVKDGVLFFNYALFKEVIHLVIEAQDIFINKASYPTDKIDYWTKYTRDLGLGFTNLGGLCMSLGFPYDSNNARVLTSYITSLMNAEAHIASINVCNKIGPPEWAKRDVNIESNKRVQRIFLDNTKKISDLFVDFKNLVIDRWNWVVNCGRSPMNAQLTLIQPTGTVSYILNSSTFGPEPEFSLMTVKKLSGNDGATITLVNRLVPAALNNLGYSKNDIDQICKDIENGIPIEHNTVIKPNHIAVFDTALAPFGGSRFISVDGHINMMAAIQPFINGAISKTLNCPSNTTAEDIFNIYFKCWRLGLKAIAIYRDGSKVDQPLTVSSGNTKDIVTEIPFVEQGNDIVPIRKKLPRKRYGLSQDFSLNGGTLKGYITANPYPDTGKLGEVFVQLATDGSTLSGVLDAYFTLLSITLQHNISLEFIAKKMINRKFEPAGFVDDKEIRSCSSVIDYVFRRLAIDFLEEDKLIELGITNSNDDVQKLVSNSNVVITSGNVCPRCGEPLFKIGKCDTCISGCGFSTGSCS